MSDHTSAEIYSRVFAALAEDPTTSNRGLALLFWAQSFDYDFSPCQIENDEALVVLGLARTKRNGDIQYATRNGVLRAR